MAKKQKINNVLFIETGPSYKKNDVPITLMALKIFMAVYQEKHPNDEIEFLDLNHEKDLHVVINEHNFETFWTDDVAAKYFKQLQKANKIIIATPMHNASYSGLLKNYLDRMLVAKKTFKYNKFGIPVGLFKAKKLQIISAQGSPKMMGLNIPHVKSLKKSIKFFTGMKIVKPIIIHSMQYRKNYGKTKAQKLEKYQSLIKRKAGFF